MHMNQILKVWFIIFFHDRPHMVITLCNLLHRDVIRFFWIHPTQPIFADEDEPRKPLSFTPPLEPSGITQSLPLLTGDSGCIDPPYWLDVDPIPCSQRVVRSPF